MTQCSAQWSGPASSCSRGIVAPSTQSSRLELCWAVRSRIAEASRDDLEGRNGQRRASSAFFRLRAGRRPRVGIRRRAVPWPGRFSEEPQAAEFEMFEDGHSHGPEAVMVAGPVPLWPELFAFPESHLDIEEDGVSGRRPVVFRLHERRAPVVRTREEHIDGRPGWLNTR